MNVIDQAVETQLKNIQVRSGKSLDELSAIIQKSGLTKFGEIREMLIRDLGMTFGDANALVKYTLKSDVKRVADGKGMSLDAVIAEMYSGAKAGLFPIHARLMEEINRFGLFEIAPKKGYVSLRRKKQFAMIGPGAKGRIDVGLNMKGIESTPRLAEMPAGGMCNYTVKVTDVKEIDDELIAWIRKAFDSSGA